MDEIDECAPAGLNALHKAQVQTYVGTVQIQFGDGLFVAKMLKSMNTNRFITTVERL